MRELWSKKIIILSASIAVFYVIATIYLMNASLVTLLTGMWTAMSRLSLFLLVAVAILTGANLTLIVQRLKVIRASGKMSFVVGGNSFLGIVGSGCASCGLPILAFLGLSGAINNLFAKFRHYINII